VTSFAITSIIDVPGDSGEKVDGTHLFEGFGFHEDTPAPPRAGEASMVRKMANAKSTERRVERIALT
jgi:hypothetical protein